MAAWQRTPADPRLAARLPPGQVLTEKFPVLHFGRVPEYPNLAGWDLRVWGAVETPLRFTWAEVLALPSAEVTLDIHCVTRWSKLDTTWTGVPLAHLAEVSGVTQAARHVILHAEGGFTTNIPLDTALDPQCVLAWHYAGRPLMPEHGFPLRAIVPGTYFWKSAKWLLGVEFRVEDELGFWERNGYHNRADPWREERYAR